MFRALLPVFALAFASAAMAGGCATTDGADNCVRFLGCIGDQGRWFDGTAIGRGHGTLTATTSDGITCTGSFDQQTGLYGTAEADCADGTRMTVMFLYQDSYTGTALGHGQTDTGQAIKTWSGNNIPDLLKRTDPQGRPNLPCGQAPLLLSRQPFFLAKIRRG